MNIVALLGRVTKDPEIRYSTSDHPTAVAKFNLAVDKWDGKKKAAVFVPCVAFGKTAETIEKYVPKGAQIALKGELDTSSYVNQDGEKVYTWNVKVERIYFCGKMEKKEDEPIEGFARLDDSMEDIPF